MIFRWGFHARAAVPWRMAHVSAVRPRVGAGGRGAWTVGVDFGGTNIKIGVVTGRGRVIAETVLPTRAYATPRRFVDGLHEAIEGLRAQQKLRRNRLVGVGVGAPGIVDVRRGMVYELPNVSGQWRRVPLRLLLQRRLHCRCVVDNDANAVAMGEWRCGAGRGTRHSIYITLGTGVGGGLVLNGQFVRGTIGSAGEIGHMAIAPDGPRCVCGRRGCLEAFVSTTTILRQARAAIRRGARILGRIASEHQGRLTPELVCEAARRGDQAALRIWTHVGTILGLGLANLVNLLGPERIVIGGGIAKAWPLFAGPLKQTIRAHAFEKPAAACRVVRATLGGRAGIVGGAILVWDAAGGKG